jgi:hypothetical protein
MTAQPPPKPKRIWFDTRDLSPAHDDVDLWILAGEAEIVARRRTIQRRGQPTKIIWRARREAREIGQPTRVHFVDLPARLSASITRWRPLSRASFPGPLPAPARIEGDIAWQSPAEPAAPPEQQDPLDWPQPYNEPPAITAREVEIRTLRALRTMRSRYAVRGDHHGSRDSVLSVIMQQLGRLEYEFTDATALAPAGTFWEPSRRDHSDWIDATGWWVKLDRSSREIVNLRSLNPPFSFAMIGARQARPRSHSWARRKYQAAIKELTRIANGKGSAARPGIARSGAPATEK